MHREPLPKFAQAQLDLECGGRAAAIYGKSRRVKRVVRRCCGDASRAELIILADETGPFTAAAIEKVPH